MYNLTERQKDILRWIVAQIRAGALEEEFIVLWFNGGFSIHGYRGDSNIPEFTESALSALAREDLLDCRINYRTSKSGRAYESTRSCSVTGRTYPAVDADFADLPINSTTTSVVITHNAGVVNVSSTLTSVTQTINQSSHLDEETRVSLSALVEQLRQALADAPPEQMDDAEAVAESAQDLVEAATKDRPNPRRIQVTADGLKQAAANLGAAIPMVLPIVQQIIDLVSKG